MISIHALREEGDQVIHDAGDDGLGISIHALREEGDLASPVCLCRFQDFYPRPPRGGRHHPDGTARGGKLFLSTPSARRATWSSSGCLPTHPISIHALREEGDKLALGAADVAEKFLSTPSARRATLLHLHGKQLLHISIHALREEGDICFRLPVQSVTRFLSTPSARRATSGAEALTSAFKSISIHALREEGDGETIDKVE